jgi:hypothetical protein
VPGRATAYNRNFQKILVENLGFYAGTTDPVPQGRLLAKVPGAGMETSTLANGDLKVSLNFAIDNNRDATDGRLFVKDEFVLSAKGLQVKKFNRSYSYNGLGNQKRWKGYLAASGLLTAPSKSEAQEFANRVITKDLFVQHLLGAGSGARSFIDAGAFAAQDVNDQLQLKYFEGDTQISVRKLGKKYKVVFSYVVDVDENGSNGRLIMEDHFNLRVSDLKMTSHLRRWAVHPDSYGNSEYIGLAGQLNGKAGPSLSEARSFLETVLPVLFPSRSKSPTIPPSLPPAQPVPTETPGKIPSTGTPVAIPPSGRSAGRSPARERPIQGPPAKSSRSLEPKKSGAYDYHFGKHKTIPRNASERNISGHIKRSIINQLRRKAEQYNVNPLKLTIVLKFHPTTGYLTGVSFKDLRMRGGSIPKNSLNGLFYQLSQRLHENIRAQKDLGATTINAPITVVLQ